MAEGYRSDTPFRRGSVNVIPLFREFPRNRRLTGDEEPRLMAACGSRLRALVIALLETACRVGVLLDLQWKQVRWTHNELYLPGQDVKGQRGRFVPVSRRLRAALEMLRHAPEGEECLGQKPSCLGRDGPEDKMCEDGVATGLPSG